MPQTNLALLVIDMQEVAFDDEITPAITMGDNLLEIVGQLVRGFRRHRVPIVYIQTSAASGRPYAPDAHGWAIHSDVAPEPEERVVIKHQSSGFDGTSLESILREMGIGTLAVCGIWSQFCVANTCRDAVRAGFDVAVIADAHGTVDDTVEKANAVVAEQNRLLAEQGITVLTSDELIGRLAFGTTNLF